MIISYRSSVRDAGPRKIVCSCNVSDLGSGLGPGMMSISGDQDNVVTLNLTHLA